MPHSRFSALLGGLFVVATLAQVGCGKSKVDQCNAVIETYNAVGTAVRRGFGDGTDPEVMVANIKEVEDAVDKFEATSISDAAVKASRDTLAATFRDYTKHAKLLAEVVRDAKQPAKAAAAEARLAGVQKSLEATAQNIGAGKQQLASACNTTFQ